MRKIATLLAAFALVASGCKKEITVTCTTCPADGGDFTVSVVPTRDTLRVGQSRTLTVSVSNNQQIQSITWTSSAPSVATVQNGLVQAVAPGTTTVTVTVTCNGKTRSATATIVVIADTPPPTPVRITISPKTMSLTVLQTQTATATVTGPAGVNTGVIWQSTAIAVATATNEVSTSTGETATITGIGAGTAMIIVTAVADPTVKDTLVVTVTVTTGGSGNITSIFINPTTVNLNVGSSATLSVTVNGDANADKTFTCKPTSNTTSFIQVVSTTTTSVTVRGLQVYQPGVTPRPIVVCSTNGKNANGLQLEAGAFIDTRPAGSLLALPGIQGVALDAPWGGWREVKPGSTWPISPNP
jgi:alpha-amylase